MYAIVMTVETSCYFLKANLCWCFDLDMAETFATREAAERAFSTFAKGAKKAHLASASVVTVQ